MKTNKYKGGGENESKSKTEARRVRTQAEWSVEALQQWVLKGVDVRCV